MKRSRIETGETASAHGGRRLDRLLGRALPAVTLESTAGPVQVGQLGGGRLVLFVYPHATGLPGAPAPGWDLIPGARGCTAQSCGFRDEHARITALGATVVGLSVQSVDEQRAFASRVALPYPLVSDPELRLATLMGLPTFEAGGRTFYERATFVVEKERIVQVFHPIGEPAANATEVAAWLERRRPVDTQPSRENPIETIGRSDV
jgi:peroxiredoxin